MTNLPARRPWLPTTPSPGTYRYRVYAEFSQVGVDWARTFVAERVCTPAELSAELDGWDFTMRRGTPHAIHVSVWGRLPGRELPVGSEPLRSLNVALRALPSGDRQATPSLSEWT